MSTLENLIEQTKLLKEKMQRDGQEALKVAFKEFFETHPEARAIVWTQYTPYFNDGDACEFGLGDFELKVDTSKFSEDLQKLIGYDEDDDKSDDEDVEKLEYKYGEGDAAHRIELLEDTKENRENTKKNWSPTFGMTLRPLSESEKSIVVDFDKLNKGCQQIPEVFEMIFGDHVEIVATKNGFDVHEFEHD